MDKRLLIVVNGPCGSGKTSLPKKICNYLNINYKFINFEKILIDELIENDIYYKNNVYKLIRRYNKDNSTITKKIVENENFQKKINLLYYKTRSKFKYNLINDLKLNKAFKFKKNIIFETQGSNNNDWLFNNYKDELKHYNIIFCWSIVNFNEIINRIKSRFINSINNFKENPFSSSAPRL